MYDRTTNMVFRRCLDKVEPRSAFSKEPLLHDLDRISAKIERIANKRTLREIYASRGDISSFVCEDKPIRITESYRAAAVTALGKLMKDGSIEDQDYIMLGSASRSDSIIVRDATHAVFEALGDRETITILLENTGDDRTIIRDEAEKIIQTIRFAQTPLRISIDKNAPDILGQGDEKEAFTEMVSECEASLPKETREKIAYYRSLDSIIRAERMREDDGREE